MMSSEVGFAIVSHDNPPQLARLVESIRRVYGPVRIACHHDFSQSQIPEELGPALKDVIFVPEYVRTAWARFSVVEANALAMKLLMSEPRPPRWGILLTATDYPIKSAAGVLDDLNAIEVDAWIEHRPIAPEFADTTSSGDTMIKGGSTRGLSIGEGSRNHRFCLQRYFGTEIALPRLRGGPRKARRLFRHAPFITDKALPFSRDVRCFAGLAYFSFKAKANEVIQRAIGTDNPMRQWYRDRWAPDESFFHSSLANDNRVVLGNASYRYVDWSAARRHPKVLDESDALVAMASGMHFARKVEGPRGVGFMNAIDTFLRDA